MTRKASLLSSMRAKCLDCMCGSKLEVRLCSSTDCPLYPYRFGHDPHPNQNTGFARGRLKSSRPEDEGAT
jgi:hypothetical protein